MSEFLENLGDRVLGRDGESSEPAGAGANPPVQPQQSLRPGLGGLPMDPVEPVEPAEQADESPERGRPGTNPPEEPQPGLHPGAGEPPPGDADDLADPAQQPAQGLGEPDSQ